MIDVKLGPGENSTVIVRDRYDQVIAVFTELLPGQTLEHSLATDKLQNRSELHETVKNLGIYNPVSRD